MSFVPFIFVDTGFKRTTQPIFALAFMESHRRLPVSQEVNALPVGDRTPRIQRVIQQHFQDTDGQLPMWGSIQRYKYFLAEGEAMIFDVDGTVLPEAEEHAPQTAS